MATNFGSIVIYLLSIGQPTALHKIMTHVSSASSILAIKTQYSPLAATF